VIIVKRTTKSLTRVDGDLEIENATVTSNSPDNTVHVKGSTLCYNDCTFDCNLRTSDLEGRGKKILVEGNLIVEHSVKIRRGELYVRGNMSTERMEVERQVEVSGDLNSKRVGSELKESRRRRNPQS
jgi:cytoskeletal protein CcmA (bactofilin family)